MAEQEDMGLALQNHQLEADNERLTGQNSVCNGNDDGNEYAPIEHAPAASHSGNGLVYCEEHPGTRLIVERSR